MDRIYAGVGGFCVRPFLPLYLNARTRRGKEDPSRRRERYGIASRPRPEGKLVWIHGASVGETLSALPLIERLLGADPTLHVLVTSGTLTSATLLAQRLPPRAVHQFVPLDIPAYAGRFLDHWRPDAILWLESDLWPALLSACRTRRIPAALVNARLSDTSFRRWKRWAPGWVRTMLSTFSVVMAQSSADAARWSVLAGPSLPVHQAGNLKFTTPTPPANPDEVSRLLARVGGRPRWIMASTHEGEEDIAATVHQQLAGRWPDLLSVIVPRHPDRASAIVRMLKDKTGLEVVRRSDGLLPTRDTAFYLADTLGEMGTLYAAAPVACVGGSFTPKGGHNPIEPAQCGCAVLAGPDMSNFSDVAAEMGAVGALVQVPTAAALSGEVARLIGDPALLATRQEAGRQATRQQERILSSILTVLRPVLDAGGITLP